MKTPIQILLLMFLAAALVSAEPVNNSIFQLRLAQDSPGSGTEKMTVARETVDATTKEKKTVQVVVYVQKETLLDIASVSSATVETDLLSGEPQVTVNLTPNGRKRFAQLTHDNVGKQIAIILDGKVLSTPRIAMEIPEKIATIIPITGKSPSVAAEIAVKITDAAKR